MMQGVEEMSGEAFSEASTVTMSEMQMQPGGKILIHASPVQNLASEMRGT